MHTCRTGVSVESAAKCFLCFKVTLSVVCVSCELGLKSAVNLSKSAVLLRDSGLCGLSWLWGHVVDVAFVNDVATFVMRSQNLGVTQNWVVIPASPSISR